MYDTSLRLKLQLKYKQTDIKIIDLNWQDIEYVTEDFLQPDIIVAADILYESDSFDSLTLGLKHLLTSSNYAVFAATIRNEDTISQFLEHLGIFFMLEISFNLNVKNYQNLFHFRKSQSYF